MRGFRRRRRLWRDKTGSSQPPEKQPAFSTQPNLKDKKIRSLFSWNENELRILLKVFVKG